MSKFPTIEDYVDLDKLPVDREEYDRLAAELAAIKTERDELKTQHQSWIDRIHMLNLQVSQLGEDTRLLTHQNDDLRARCERYEYRERIARSYMAYAEKYRCSCGADIDAELEMCKLRELFKEALAPSGGGGE